MTLRDSNFLKSDVLAVWYFRLNGVFTSPNFILHPPGRGSARTDADIAGVRYPFRAEFGASSGLDDPWFEEIRSTPCAVIAEVKTSECAINGPWSSAETGTLSQVLSDLGWYRSDEIDQASCALNELGQYQGARLFCSLFCIGNRKSDTVRERYPLVPQRSWSEVATWIFNRFNEYQRRKKDHNQWDNVGQALWTYFEQAASPGEFERAIRRHFLLPGS